jgi:xylulokinase
MALGQQPTFRDLCGRIVKLDDDTRCEPNPDLREVYTQLLTRQGDLTRRMHAAGYL